MNLKKTAATKKLELTIEELSDLISNKSNDSSISKLLTHAEAYIAEGADVQTLVKKAVWLGDSSLFHLFVKAGVNPLITMEEGKTLLHQAVIYGSRSKALFSDLIDCGIDPETKDDNGKTALHLARSMKNSKDWIDDLRKAIAKGHPIKSGATKSKDTTSHESFSVDFTLWKKTWASIKEDVKKNPLFKQQGGSIKELESFAKSYFLDEPTADPQSMFNELTDQHSPGNVWAAVCVWQAFDFPATKKKTIKEDEKVPSFYFGDLVIKKKEVDIISLVVLGNLTVEGVLKNFEGRNIYVGKNLKAKSMFTEGPALVGGSLSAEAIFASYNDYSLCVSEELSAKYLIIDEHQIIAKSIDVENQYNLRDDKIPKEQKAKIKKLLGMNKLKI